MNEFVLPAVCVLLAILNFISFFPDKIVFLNEFITQKLLEGAKDCLDRHKVSEDNIDGAWVPGAFEIPLIASKMAKSKNMMQ